MNVSVLFPQSQQTQLSDEILAVDHLTDRELLDHRKIPVIY